MPPNFFYFHQILKKDVLDPGYCLAWYGTHPGIDGYCTSGHLDTKFSYEYPDTTAVPCVHTMVTKRIRILNLVVQYYKA